MMYPNLQLLKTLFHLYFKEVLIVMIGIFRFVATLSVLFLIAFICDEIVSGRRK